MPAGHMTLVKQLMFHVSGVFTKVITLPHFPGTLDNTTAWDISMLHLVICDECDNLFFFPCLGDELSTKCPDLSIRFNLDQAPAKLRLC